MAVDLSKINLNFETVEEARVVVMQLVAIIKELQEQLNTNSKNSSLPPSRDFKKKVVKRKSGRKPGGQVGHLGVKHKLLPEEQVTEWVVCKPEPLCDCGGEVKLKKKPHRHQVLEIPEPRFEVTEYQVYREKAEEAIELF